jgi:phosphate starvation-inducible PhoH-like protein
VQEVLDVPNEVAAELAGIGDGVLTALRERLGCGVNLRGNRLTLSGDEPNVSEARAVIEELVDLVEGGQEIGAGTVDTILDAIDRAEDVREIFEDVVWSHRGKRITPKTVTQKHYVDAIRNRTVTFGIGPAGTGKTYLAIALAVSALSERQVGRIILTRPAVEAGERLGFLPGDVLAKVDPYMRPLFDALYDTMDPERLNAYIERGTIEVAPLAFMRGRAQPLSSRVLTPEGFRPIGGLRVGDLVTGSDGRPTPVLGVYPQGPKEVFRLRTQDGASTLCCGEHLWHVFTPEDSRRGKPGRVLETREMVGRLRRAHQHRYELPLLSAPAEFEPRDLPMDPYALGLLLGDGCLTATTTPTFSTSDPELTAALEGSLDGIDVQWKRAYDYVLRHVHGHRGGVIVANPVTAVLRELGLAGTYSHTKFIPELYARNSVDARIALLQGLLDSDGGPVTQDGRTCRIQYTTCSKRLRDDVAYLVRSLGGIAYSRRRSAEGRAPGMARGRPIPYRHDSFVMDLRLPAGIQPFRLQRKLDTYRRHGGGRPMRFIDEIEPAGEAETVCIQVAAADSLYVTDDFLLTHNTLNDSFIILDEAQNTSPEQMQMFLTRLGFGSKMVVTGDVTQIDLPREQASGLIQVQSILSTVDGIAFVHFTHQDVVRHKLVQRIVEAYKQHSEETGSERRR